MQSREARARALLLDIMARVPIGQAGLPGLAPEPKYKHFNAKNPFLQFARQPDNNAKYQASHPGSSVPRKMGHR